MTLPSGLSVRPLTLDGVDAVVAMVNDCELHDTGERMWERADLLSDSSTDGFDRDRRVGVFHADRILAWAMLLFRRYVWADVHPDARALGVGTWLREWSESRGREIGTDRVGQTIDDRLTDVAHMFLRVGYTPRHTSWILLMEHDEPPAEASMPDGIELRPIRATDEEEGAFDMFERAFSEFTDRSPSTPATWRAMTLEREGFVPEDLIVATDGDRVVGGAFLLDSNEIWVDKIAVDREYRHQGIARALLQTAFRRSFERGYKQTRLSTDSRTGALALYERLGMRVQRSFTHYGLDLKTRE